MSATPSLLRRAEHEALKTVTLSGNVLDLGGEKGAEYLSCIQGDFTVTAVNLDTSVKPDIFHDLETPLSLPDASYDHVLLINVLEHVFNYHQLLQEAVRIVRPGGSVIIIVPFLFPIHPSPRDFWRFSAEALLRELELVGLKKSQVQSLGSGVFAARSLLLNRLLPSPLRFISYYTTQYVTMFLDRSFTTLALVLGKQYSTREYPLGYMATAHKS
jgi:SAM-dependent methyltransferase